MNKHTADKEQLKDREAERGRARGGPRICDGVRIDYTNYLAHSDNKATHKSESAKLKQ